MRRARLVGATPALALAFALALATLATMAAGAGVFELQILEFSNYRLRLASGACCGGFGGAAGVACGRPCRAAFTLCLKEYQSAAAPTACSFGRAVSPVLGTDSFVLAEPLYTLALPFTFRWTRSFTMILQAFDDFNYTSSEAAGAGAGAGETGLIEEAWWSGIVEPGGAWHALRHTGSNAAMAYRVRVMCQPNYYNTTCTTFCRPRDDKFGHYSCQADGAKRCLPGWQGDNCENPVCKEGCHPAHGRCDRPGDCDCRPGWRGELCAQCQPYPGCKHGYCNGSSWDCTCDTNWGGILCDQDLNYCGTHEPCRHGGTCENTAPDQYLCSCADGFSGADCEVVDNPCAPQPCRHGACLLADSDADDGRPGPGYRCQCERGWAGDHCDEDEDDCADRPCAHGTCRDLLAAYRCDCRPGWRGARCDEDEDECLPNGGLGPCVNARACRNGAGDYSCECLPGWSGRHCDTNVDDCQRRPCLNGATCIDLVDDFHCACASGFAGRTCARDVDDCAARPCRNGGDCVDLRDAYRCICPVGFTGHDCELVSCSGRYCSDDRDHCAGAPCANGAACYTAQDEYYCHCAPGYQGKNCSQPAAPACRPACQHGGRCVAGACVCEAPWTGRACAEPACSCQNGGSCVWDGTAWRCACAQGYAGSACELPVPAAASPSGACPCGPGGTCAPAASPSGWTCACRPGWTGALCERPSDACASQPCQHGGRCVSGGGWWACQCAQGWSGPDCSHRAPCEPACPPPAHCSTALSTASAAVDAPAPPRCLCPEPPERAERCLEVLAGLGGAGEAEEALALQEGGCARNGTWWAGCNACWCAAGRGGCTAVWCGLPDCLGGAACRPDEVCVPAARGLCLRAPCAPLGECRRVAGRRVEPPALPAPPGCWPGARGPPPPGCARLVLAVTRDRLLPTAHVERACGALRRALAAALAARTLRAPVALLCDLAADDEDALDLALWAGEESGGEESAALSVAVRALSELVSRRRLDSHALLGAARALRAVPAAAAGSAWPALLSSLAALALLLVGAAWLWRRRRAAHERAMRCDEEKSNNLQNEENLRRYANPLRAAVAGAAADRDAASGGLRAHSLYKPQNADVRNHTPPTPHDKELSMRALVAPHPHPHPHQCPPAHRNPPERLTVLV